MSELNPSSNIKKVASGISGIFKGVVAAYFFVAVPVHDIWTGESLLSKTWNSAVVSNMEDSQSCKRDGVLDGTFICEKRGDGKGLDTLIPKSLDI